jgi:hypothetical protein
METLQHKLLSAAKLLDKLTPFTSLKPNRFGKRPIHLRGNEYLCLRPTPGAIDELFDAVDQRSDWELVEEVINMRHYRLSDKLVYGIVIFHIPTGTYIFVRTCYKMGNNVEDYWEGKGGIVSSSPIIRLVPRQGEPPRQLREFSPHRGEMGNLTLDPEGKYVWISKGHTAHVDDIDEGSITLWPPQWNITSGGE